MQFSLWAGSFLDAVFEGRFETGIHPDAHELLNLLIILKALFTKCFLEGLKDVEIRWEVRTVGSVFNGSPAYLSQFLGVLAYSARFCIAMQEQNISDGLTVPSQQTFNSNLIKKLTVVGSVYCPIIMEKVKQQNSMRISENPRLHLPGWQVRFGFWWSRFPLLLPFHTDPFQLGGVMVNPSYVTSRILQKSLPFILQISKKQETWTLAFFWSALSRCGIHCTDTSWNSSWFRIMECTLPILISATVKRLPSMRSLTVMFYGVKLQRKCLAWLKFLTVSHPLSNLTY